MNNMCNVLDSQFSFYWCVKSTPYIIKYRKAFKIEEIDDIFCTIINSFNGKLSYEDLASILGFNLQDIAEQDIYNIYLNKLKEFSLINLQSTQIELSELGYQALNTGLKYKYFQAETVLFTNNSVNDDDVFFSFKNYFNLTNTVNPNSSNFIDSINDIDLINQLQFQLFDNNIFRGEVLDVTFSNKVINYSNIKLSCKSNLVDGCFKVEFYFNNTLIHDIDYLINKPENSLIKEEIYHKAMQNYILENHNTIQYQDIVDYKDLWNWNDKFLIKKIDWDDQRILSLFKDVAQGSTWYTLSENIPISSLIDNINEFKNFWYWPIVTKRIDDELILSSFRDYPWDFEQLSYKSIYLVQTLLSDFYSQDQNWDWIYLSNNLTDTFIEDNIDKFPWDYFSITKSKNEIFKNTFLKFKDQLDLLITKNWDWKYISEQINIKFLYKNLDKLAPKLNWNTILNRFFNNEQITAKCTTEQTLHSILKLHLPNNFIISNQNYNWSIEVIDFFENLELINWQTSPYSDGFDTNEYVDWNLEIFQKYHSKITTEKGLYNVSRLISDFQIINMFREFCWDPKGLSNNKFLINDIKFIGNSFVGYFKFSDKLQWGKIIETSTLGLDFWNTYLDSFTSSFSTENQTDFWSSLTTKNNPEFIFSNTQYPWDWEYITSNASLDQIITSLEDNKLIKKWNWKIATTKFDSQAILENLDNIVCYIDWEYVIRNILSVDNELKSDKELTQIATCLYQLEDEYRKDIWSVLTTQYSFENLFYLIENTEDIEIFQWDWNYISSHKLFPTDIRNLKRYSNKINWSIFSESPSIEEKFSFSNWDSISDYYRALNNYLTTFKNNWDWARLSGLRDINYSRKIVLKYIDQDWDWQYLSEFGGLLKKIKKDDNNYLIGLLARLPKIDFKLISKRNDIVINNDVVLSLLNKNWDWEALSLNKHFVFDQEFIQQTKEKPWNWKLLSENINFEISNDLIINLINKNWDWESLTCNQNLDFNYEFIKATLNQDWNWTIMSKHRSFIPSYEILSLIKNKEIDWEYLSSHNKLEPSIDLLTKFENKLNWKLVTQNKNLAFEADLIDRFIDKWDWNYICQSGNLKLSGEVLDKYSKFINWDLISSNTSIDFTKDIIDSFEYFWNWTYLKTNAAIDKSLQEYVISKIDNSVSLTFLNKIAEQSSIWKGSIYHFSHIDNAVEIIKNRKIQSRNLATIKSDAAGSVVHRRNDAHNYARFYFRPQTPTQFYNEFLGKNSTDKYYHSASHLGNPKCPIPIFFRFSLKEVLTKNFDKCCISNGNMQKNHTRFDSIDKMLGLFNFDHLYTSINENHEMYKEYSQQEFLIINEFLFDNIIDFEIICPSENDKELLIYMLGKVDAQILSKIVVDYSYYNLENPRVLVEKEDDEIYIKNQFIGEGYFELIGDNLNNLEILTGDVKRKNSNKILFDTHISLKNITDNIKLYFVDETKRSWFIYTN